MVAALKEAKYPGGFKAYHQMRNIPVPRQTCLRYADLYDDVKCLGLKDEVLTAAYTAGLDLVSMSPKSSTRGLRFKRWMVPGSSLFCERDQLRNTVRQNP
jgi:hypothetical protein